MLSNVIIINSIDSKKLWKDDLAITPGKLLKAIKLFSSFEDYRSPIMPKDTTYMPIFLDQLPGFKKERIKDILSSVTGGPLDTWKEIGLNNIPKIVYLTTKEQIEEFYRLILKEYVIFTDKIVASAIDDIFLKQMKPIIGNIEQDEIDVLFRKILQYFENEIKTHLDFSNVAHILSKIDRIQSFAEHYMQFMRTDKIKIEVYYDDLQSMGLSENGAIRILDEKFHIVLQQETQKFLIEEAQKLKDVKDVGQELLSTLEKKRVNFLKENKAEILQDAHNKFLRGEECIVLTKGFAKQIDDTEIIKKLLLTIIEHQKKPTKPPFTRRSESFVESLETKRRNEQDQAIRV
ncbi:hypothetical protein Cyrtocomes_00812 [Candidatus Cyrtobacter comes]|uniref:Uncharacterized protein n=1 Tax=Candidatus Cyrtobacter comes TaxID=675776 RepID=A0ABU5L9B8_9RICK|nr:hypothetical protein [Candidatus Cyrtobacter comes]MDZ5762429.1 hypothetical protein [Candidatus Cyrtobacter comes]